MKSFSLSACTAMQLTSSGGAPYLFRTCDIDSDIFADGAHIAAFPAGETLSLSCGEVTAGHTLMGMTFNDDPRQLLDGINGAGLCGGLLMLHEGTSLPAHPQGIVGMELITRMLAECSDTQDVLRVAEDIRILDIPHGDRLVPASMHYFFTDIRGRSIVLEAADPLNRGKLTAYPQSIGILTNSPPYPQQLNNLRWFLAHSPELAGRELRLEGITIAPVAAAPHLSESGTFPASYAAYDRFIRAAVLKSLCSDGRGFSDEQMLPLGYNIMHALFEPKNSGVFHYTDIKNGIPRGRKNSFTQYIILYDITRRSMFIRPYDAVVWSSLRMEALPDHPCAYSVCRDPESGILPAEPQ